MVDEKLNSELVNAFNECKTMLANVEPELLKSTTGNVSAGLRVRHGMRALKKAAGEVVKCSKALDAAVKAEKKSRKAAKVSE